MKSFGDIVRHEDKRESRHWSSPQNTLAEDNELLEESKEYREYRREIKYHPTEVKGRR